MAAIGGMMVRAQVGQLCAARHQICVAGFQAITQQSANDRSQSCSISDHMVPAAIAREGVNGAYRCPAWGRDKTLISGYNSRGFGTQSCGVWGSFLKGWQDGKTVARPSATASNGFGEDVRVDTRAREPEWLEPEDDQKQKEERGLSVVDADKEGQTAAIADKALDKSSNVATSALDKVGDVLSSTGLEINLDLGLQELTIEKLVLRDLSLVLEVKTKPQPQKE